jgi:hypothetical protein
MKWLFRVATQRAIAKGSGRWATLGVVIAMLRFLRRISGAEPHRMYKHTLQPDDVLVVKEPKSSSPR